jgi:hypothetical protein
MGWQVTLRRHSGFGGIGDHGEVGYFNTPLGVISK